MNKSKYSFLINDMRWSYSRVSAFETCPYQWKLIYLDKLKTVENYFAQFGTHVHEVFERFWAGDIEVSSLPDYFENKYADVVLTRPPSILERWDFEKKSKDSVLKFFQHFDLVLEDYEILGNEFTVKAEYEDINLTIRPDTIVKNKKTGKVTLIDYKSSKMYDKKDRLIKKKLPDYKKQLAIYCYFIESELGIHIDEFMLIFPKYSLDKSVAFEYNKDIGQESVDWMMGVIAEIKQENDFEPKVDSFFCGQLCGVRGVCPHWRKDKK